eukprot:TRINITY_DN48274_c0_g3_i1.p1 TRINITY_DN48274_c0_g3~~TRINITY_DN48274_c0_g3_i1.p1  ORF type:complete len:269 (+),score=60.45 TRINITY_DN48274_c0_g3_i1:123-809(+)
MAIVLAMSVIVAVFQGSSSQDYLTCFGDLKVCGFGVGVINTTLIIVQSLFPIVLSYRHELEAKRAKALENVASNSKPSVLPLKLLQEQLEAIIADQRLRTILLEFLESEFAVENLFFIEVCDHFKASCSQSSREELLKQLDMIRSTFVVDSSSHVVNLSHRTRASVLERIGRLFRADDETTTVDPELLDTAREEVFNLLLTDNFKRFRIKHRLSNIAPPRPTGIVETL